MEDNDLFLDCLFELGVDNWEGFSEAVALYNKRLDEKENEIGKPQLV